MNHKIEFATLDDTKDILDIYAPYILNTSITFEYEVPSIEEFKNRIKKVTSYYPWLVYKVDEKIVAYAYASQYKERAAFMWDTEVSIYISPNYQGRGIAKILYRCLFDLLWLQGFYNIYALISVPNEKSIALHDSFGFELVGTYINTGFKLNHWCNLASLVKKLREAKEKPEPTVNIHDIDQQLREDIFTKYII